ncbi:MAG TPA: DUF11 domain-containing protein [Mycobacteriales bacterium]|nr:DUF11 domain-containing protein [Mycobacteriales bacterium]
MPQRLSPVALLSATTAVLMSSAAFVAVSPAAHAASASPYSGSATADLVHLNAVNIPGTFNLADATLAPVTSTVNTATSPRVRSFATNANAQLLSAAINQNLVVEALQTAPPDHAQGVHDELLTVPAAPVLTATVTSADAHSRFNADDSCITNGPLSRSISRVAQAAVLPGSPAAVALHNTGDPDGAAVSETTIGLVKQPASAANYAVRSTSSTQITSVDLFGKAIVVEVVTAPKVVATATGVAGTSSVVVTQPVLKINGQTLVSGETIRPLNIPALPVIEVTAGTVTATKSADGTTASGMGNLLSVRVLDVTGAITLATLTVGDVNASAKAPLGGVSCQSLTNDPLRDARKDAAATSVHAGQTFDYTITVPNRGNADLTNVTVRDTTSGSPALVLVSATPAATSHSGNTYTFSLGTIAPNQVKTIRMTFRVPSSADPGTKYANTAVITATYGGKTITKTVHTPYPTVDTAGAGPCDLSRSTKFASHLKVKHNQKFTYYVNVFNQGGRTCTGIVIKDALPKGTAFVSCTAGCTHTGQLVTWRIASLPASASRMLAVTVTATATSGRLPNAADITPDSGTGGTPRTPGPLVTTTSVLAPSVPASRGDSQFPRTGGSPMLALAGLTLLGAGVLLRRRALI